MAVVETANNFHMGEELLEVVPEGLTDKLLELKREHTARGKETARQEKEQRKFTVMGFADLKEP